MKVYRSTVCLRVCTTGRAAEADYGKRWKSFIQSFLWPHKKRKKSNLKTKHEIVIWARDGKVFNLHNIRNKKQQNNIIHLNFTITTAPEKKRAGKKFCRRYFGRKSDRHRPFISSSDGKIDDPNNSIKNLNRRGKYYIWNYPTSGHHFKQFIMRIRQLITLS